MSAAAALNKAGPSASKDKKAKRPRKRSRNKKRTTQVEDDDSSGSSSDDSDDEEQAPKPKAAPVETPRKSAKKTEPDSDSDSDSDDEGKDDGADGDAKRKRKRKRSKKKATEESTKTAAAPAVTASSASSAKPVTLSPDQIGPDPNTDLRLSDQAKQAIQYAQVYTKDKTQWKFNKAKQNWLVRNALSVPPSDYDASLARKQSETTDAAEGAGEEDGDEAEEGENFVPDDFVAVVTAYLTSVMGGARQRLIESLREAVHAPAVTVAPVQSEAAAQGTTAEEQSTDAAANGTAATGTTKSVSFGNLALETEKKEEAAEAAGLPTGTDPRAVELRRTRATLMLQQMGEAL